MQGDRCRWRDARVQSTQASHRFLDIDFYMDIQAAVIDFYTDIQAAGIDISIWIFKLIFLFLDIF